MRYFIAFLAQEQKRIGSAVDDIIARLPEYVRPAAKYALSTGGKRLRPALSVLCARALGYKGDDVYSLSATLEFFHVATLLHDDILDNADTRRSHPATHTQFGVPATLLAADAMVARAFQTLAETNDPRFMHCLTKAVIGTADGEIMEIAMQGRTDGGLSAYTAIIEGKTACLLRSACEIGALCAHASDEALASVSAYGLNLGMAFQVADDVLDFSPSEVIGKPSGGDLREGKFTPPIAFYTASLDEKERAEFTKRFSERSLSEEEAERIVAAVRNGGFQEQAKVLATSYLDKAQKALDSFPDIDSGSKWARDALAEALIFVRDRKA